ncbi:uncharacterized protein DUF2493 [Spirosoma oryzae]|uniref:Uncharacterized protein DUF2493 n=1 Tax=Spirosoma oryzae TaxID=1469603 RepID=A0A2T0S8S5_9BACT|nr:DUF2493 domain-containing protein [Spirosoma oryzae]PRY29829.1 uncharacterized protein DUF2493 [Spirosoma oryzae]
MEEEFKVIIAGTRTFNDYKLLNDTCLAMLSQKMRTHNVSILCGGAKGADLLGYQWAQENRLPVHDFPADWRRHGRSAGHLRNAQMVEVADAAIFFWDGVSTGTAGCIELARFKGIRIKIVYYNDKETTQAGVR